MITGAHVIMFVPDAEATRAFLRDVIGLEIGDGTEQVSKLVISRALLGREFAP